MPAKTQEEVIKELRQAYQITFSTKEGAAVLQDLENRTEYTHLLLMQIRIRLQT